MKQAGIVALMNARDDSSVRKFNGKLEVSDSTSKIEMDKEDFFETLKDKVAFYGLHNFFYLPSTDGTMLSLLTDSHALRFAAATNKFSIKTVSAVILAMVPLVERLIAKELKSPEYGAIMHDCWTKFSTHYFGLFALVLLLLLPHV